MIKDLRFWGASVAVSCLGLVFLTPDGIGEQLWNAVKVPVVLLVGGTWVGFVLTIIARNTGGSPTQPSGDGDVDLTVAAAPDETVIAAARLSTKLVVAVLGLGCLTLAVWDGVLRSTHEFGRAGIWVIATAGLAFYLAKLLHRRVVLSPAGISWRERGEAVSRTYADVQDFQVLSQREIRVLFSDGRKVAVTSDMADLRKVLATITARRIA